VGFVQRNKVIIFIKHYVLPGVFLEGFFISVLNPKLKIVVDVDHIINALIFQPVVLSCLFKYTPIVLTTQSTTNMAKLLNGKFL
jgi:hypothetical protein